MTERAEVAALTYERAVAAVTEARARLQEERDRHEEAARTLGRAMVDAERTLLIYETAGAQAAMDREVAERVLDIGWWSTRRHGARVSTPEVQSCFLDAIEDLRVGAPRLRRGYFGVKEYDGWASQRADCEYGMGPSHGSIWFRIGLRRRTEPLTEDEQLAAVRWLRTVQSNPELLG